MRTDARDSKPAALRAPHGAGCLRQTRSPELTFDKTSYADGHFDLRIESGGDVASFAVGAAGTTVSRSGRTAIVGLAPTEQDFERARTLLAGSRAVKRYRQLAASVEQS